MSVKWNDNCSMGVSGEFESSASLVCGLLFLDYWWQEDLVARWFFGGEFIGGETPW